MYVARDEFRREGTIAQRSCAELPTMSLSDADGLSGVRRRATRILDRVASVLPTVRARLFALVLVALVPALVILVYDEWLARERGFAALTRSVDAGRSPDAAGDGRPHHARRAPAWRARGRSGRRRALSRGDAQAGRCAARRSPLQQPPDRRRHDRRCAGERRTARSQGQRARPARVRAGPAHARLRDRGLSSRTGHRRTGSQSRTTRRERGRHADVRRVREHRPRLGGRVHRTLRPSRRAPC